MKTVAVVHFNTPELTRAAILSIRKHGGADYRYVVFDNSDRRPFGKMDGVEVIDNTKGKYVNFDKELDKYPNKCPEIGCATGNFFGSDKHMMSVQKLFDLIPEGFLLIDSDIIVTKSVDFMFRDNYLCVGSVHHQPYNSFSVPRIVPMLCYINVPLCKANNINYFDPERSWALHEGGRDNRNNWYDTGASFFEDVHKNKAKGLNIDIRPLMLHFRSGSWRNNSIGAAASWMLNNAKHWVQEWPRIKSKKIALCAIGRLENRYAPEFVKYHLNLGFDKVIIYDNNYDGEEHFEDVLSDYIKKKKVEIIDWRNRNHQQCAAYTDCYSRYGQKYAWLAFFDFDEHLKLAKHKKVGEFLAEIKGDAVGISWRAMTDNGLLEDDGRDLEKRFKEPTPPGTLNPHGLDINSYLKSIVRGGLPWAIFTDPHYPTIPGYSVYSDGTPRKAKSIYNDYNYSVARLDHFITKTAQEFIDNKVKRGLGCQPDNTKRMRENPGSYFFCYNKRTPEKEAIIFGKPKTKK